MENLEIRIQKTTFDVETQYCDPREPKRIASINGIYREIRKAAFKLCIMSAW